MSEKGTVAMFFDRKGYGFIKPSNGDEDIYVHRDNVSGGGILDGDEVRYDVETNDRNGKQMAVNVTGGTGGDTWGKGKSKGGKDNRSKPEKEGEKKGTVTIFYGRKGFGFIKPEEGEEELFVSRDDVYGGGLLDGDEVTYDETTNDRNGKLKAVNVSGGTGGNSWGKGDEGKGDSWGKGGYGKGDRWGKSDSWGKGDRGGKGYSRKGDSWGKSEWGGKGKERSGKGKDRSEHRVTEKGCSGTVAMFLDRKGYGFIKPDEGGDDLFVLRDDVDGGGLLDGDQVYYDLAEDDRTSKSKAVNVTGGTGGDRWGRPKGEGGKGKGRDDDYNR